MKLIDLLVKELPKRGGWPKCAVKIHQDHDGETWAWLNHDSTERLFTLDQVATNARKFGQDETCENMVTREQYEAALAASEGWIEWCGGDCPADGDAIVEVKYRKPNPCQFNNDRAGYFSWAHDGIDGDIIAYRLKQPTKSEQVRDDAAEKDDEADLNECIGRDVDVVNHPSHYTKGRIECIDAIDSATTGKSGIEAVCVGNVIKYLWRYEEKNGLEDVKKAKWYLNKLISELEDK